LPLKALFERTSVAQFAELLFGPQNNHVPPIRPVDRTHFDRLPLSFAQERIWFLDQFEPQNAVYNIPVAVTIRGEVDINQLDRAFNLIIARHENLRAVFPSDEGRPQQLIRDSLEFQLDRIDLSHLEGADVRVAKAREICEADVAMPFDLAQGP